MSNDDIQAFVIDCITDPGNRDKQTALAQWLQESENNRALYAEIKRIWDIAGTIPAAPFSTTEGWASLSRTIETPVRKMFSWTRVAAVLIPLCIVAWWIYNTHNNNEWVNYVASQKDSVLLPDGSTIYVKPGAVIAYNKQRTVKLSKGEAFFKVVKDQQQFTVQLPKAEVTVLGTSFNITLDSSLTDVAVSDGKVSVATDDKRIVLTEGELGRVEKGTLNKVAGNYTYRGGWISGYFVFQNEEAGTVAAVLSDYYHTKITIPDSLAQKRITVKFRNETLKEVEAVLAGVLDK